MEFPAVTLALIAIPCVIGLGAGWLSYRKRMRDLLAGLERHLREEAAERQAQRLRCCCEDCDIKAHGGLRTKMSVCPECGDKRCPRAAHHDPGCDTTLTAMHPSPPPASRYIARLGNGGVVLFAQERINERERHAQYQNNLDGAD